MTSQSHSSVVGQTVGVAHGHAHAAHVAPVAVPHAAPAPIGLPRHQTILSSGRKGDTVKIAGFQGLKVKSYDENLVRIVYYS